MGTTTKAAAGLPGVPEPSDNGSRPEDGDQDAILQDPDVGYSPAGEVVT